MKALKTYFFVSIKQDVYQVFASAITSVRHCEPCAAWRSNPPVTRQPNSTGDCFVPRNDEDTENYYRLISTKQKFDWHFIQHVLLVLLSICSINLFAQTKASSSPITVDANGTGKFTSCQILAEPV